MLQGVRVIRTGMCQLRRRDGIDRQFGRLVTVGMDMQMHARSMQGLDDIAQLGGGNVPQAVLGAVVIAGPRRSEEHTSELQSLMRISYAVFCLKKKKEIQATKTIRIQTQPMPQ